MRILEGKKVVEAPVDWRARVLAKSRPVTIDLGAGDGRYAYECARNDPDRFYIAIDPDALTMADYAYRASRKPARGGVENVAFVVAAVEAVPPKLGAIAALVRVNFPWGSLMRGLLEPRSQTIEAIAGMLAPGGRIEVIMSYHPDHDTNAFQGLPLPELDDVSLRERLLPAYEAAGMVVSESRRMTLDEVLEVPSTWGRRLLHARPRDVYYIAMMPHPLR